jgi:hypothetical protein
VENRNSIVHVHTASRSLKQGIEADPWGTVRGLWPSPAVTMKPTISIFSGVTPYHYRRFLHVSQKTVTSNSNELGVYAQVNNSDAFALCLELLMLLYTAQVRHGGRTRASNQSTGSGVMTRHCINTQLVSLSPKQDDIREKCAGHKRVFKLSPELPYGNLLLTNLH